MACLSGAVTSLRQHRKLRPMAKRMDAQTRDFIEQLLASHNILTLATLREDGWPQATTVGYVNDGLTLYVGAAAESQKVQISAAATRSPSPLTTMSLIGAAFRGCRMAARATLVINPSERERARW
jgi:Pyridoxamine 5'-phosphate oxidase